MLRNTTANEILDFGEQVAEDEDFWTNLPSQLVPSAEKSAGMTLAARAIGEIDSPVDFEEGGLDSLLEEAKSGVSRESLRKDLRETLNESR